MQFAFDDQCRTRLDERRSAFIRSIADRNWQELQRVAARTSRPSQLFLSHSLSLRFISQPRAKSDELFRPRSLSRHACIHALMKRTMHTELTPLPAQLTRRITQPGGDNGEERARVPHTTTTPPHHATRPAGRISHQRSRVRPQSASVIGCRGPRELLVSSPSASTSSSPLFPRTRRTAYSSIHVVYYITYQ